MIAFVIPAIFTFFIGLMMVIFGEEEILTNKEGFALVAFGWLGAAATGALPYVLLGLSPIDALFESMSGFTTTGASILSEAGADGLWTMNATAASYGLAASLAHIAFSNISMGQAIDPASFVGSNISALNETLLNATLNGIAGGGRGQRQLRTGRADLSRPSLLEVLQPVGLVGWVIIVIFHSDPPELWGWRAASSSRPRFRGPTEDLIRPGSGRTARSLGGLHGPHGWPSSSLLMLARMRIRCGYVTTFSTVSTGGFSPRADSIAYYLRPDFNAPSSGRSSSSSCSSPARASPSTIGRCTSNRTSLTEIR